MKITKPIYTAAAKVNPVTFEEFLKAVKVNRDPQHIDGIITFNSMMAWNSFVGSAFTMEEEGCEQTVEDAIYSRRTVKLDTKDKLFQSLIDQSRKAFIYYKGLHELVEDMHLAHSMQHGNPSHMIKLGKRMWMAASPDDFMLFERDGRYALACMNMGRTVAVTVKKIAEAKSFVDKIDSFIKKDVV